MKVWSSGLGAPIAVAGAIREDFLEEEGLKLGVFLNVSIFI